VQPQRLMDSGYRFEYQKLESALEAILKA